MSHLFDKILSYFCPHVLVPYSLSLQVDLRSYKIFEQLCTSLKEKDKEEDSININYKNYKNSATTKGNISTQLQMNHQNKYINNNTIDSTIQ